MPQVNRIAEHFRHLVETPEKDWDRPAQIVTPGVAFFGGFLCGMIFALALAANR